jgi:hypothetical protein
MPNGYTNILGGPVWTDWVPRADLEANRSAFWCRDVDSPDDINLPVTVTIFMPTNMASGSGDETAVAEAMR